MSITQEAILNVMRRDGYFVVNNNGCIVLDFKRYYYYIKLIEREDI